MCVDKCEFREHMCTRCSTGLPHLMSKIHWTKKGYIDELDGWTTGNFHVTTYKKMWISSFDIIFFKLTFIDSRPLQANSRCFWEEYSNQKISVQALAIVWQWIFSTTKFHTIYSCYIKLSGLPAYQSIESHAKDANQTQITSTML